MPPSVNRKQVQSATWCHFCFLFHFLHLLSTLAHQHIPSWSIYLGWKFWLPFVNEIWLWITSESGVEYICERSTIFDRKHPLLDQFWWWTFTVEYIFKNWIWFCKSTWPKVNCNHQWPKIKRNPSNLVHFLNIWIFLWKKP